VRDAVLRQVAGGVRARADDLAGVGVDEAEDDLQQRRLAGAIRPDDRDALVVADTQREVAEEELAAVLLLEVVEGDQIVQPFFPAMLLIARSTSLCVFPVQVAPGLGILL
jgi:hypothetical protein